MRLRALCRAAWVAGAAGLAGLGTPGCSFIFTERPPADHAERAYFTCTTSAAAPILDSVFTGLQTMGLLSLAKDDEQALSKEQFGVQVATAAVAGASAIYGFSQLDHCREAREQLSVRAGRERDALLRYRYEQSLAPSAPRSPPVSPPASPHPSVEGLAPAETPEGQR